MMPLGRLRAAAFPGCKWFSIEAVARLMSERAVEISIKLVVIADCLIVQNQKAKAFLRCIRWMLEQYGVVTFDLDGWKMKMLWIWYDKRNTKSNHWAYKDEMTESLLLTLCHSRCQKVSGRSHWGGLETKKCLPESTWYHILLTLYQNICLLWAASVATVGFSLTFWCMLPVPPLHASVCLSYDADQTWSRKQEKRNILRL